MLCLKKRRTYSFTQGACKDIPRRSAKKKNDYNETLNIAVTTLPRKHRNREEQSSGGMVLTVTEDTPADMLAGSMELLVQLPRDQNVHTQRVTVPRSTPMMDLLAQIAMAHKLSASSYTLQAIGERGLVLPHQPNTPIGALDALQIKLLPKQGTLAPRKPKQANQPFEMTFRLQVLLPRNQLYVSRVSPKTNLGKILDEVCREKNLDKSKYELRHPANLEEVLDLSLSLQDYHLQEVTLYAKQGSLGLGSALSSQDIMALQRQEERRRQQAKQSVFGFMLRKSKESSLSIESLGERSVSPARSDETGRSVSPGAPGPPSRPLRKRRPAPKPPTNLRPPISADPEDDTRDKLVISHSRNSSDSSGYHEASVLSDNADSNGRMPETLPRRSKPPCKMENSRKLAHTSQTSKSLGNLAIGGLSHGISSSSINSAGARKKRAAPPPPAARPLTSAISSQALERIVDSEESLTSDIDISKSPSDIAASSKANSDIGVNSKANSDIGVNSKANSDIGVHSMGSKQSLEIGYKIDAEFRAALADHEDKNSEISDVQKADAPPPPRPDPKPPQEASDPARSKTTPNVKASSSAKPQLQAPLEQPEIVENSRLAKRENPAPIPKPRIPIKASADSAPIANARKNAKIMDSKTPSSGIPVEFSNEKEEKAANDFENSEKIEENPNEISAIESPRIKEKSDNASLKHVKSMDDIYGASIQFTGNNEEVEEKNPDSTENFGGRDSPSCAVISTIPKCAHLSKNSDEFGEKLDSSNGKFVDKSCGKKKFAKRMKVFRSQSAFDDFDVNNALEKPIDRHLTSYPEDFKCALNPNFPPKIVHPEEENLKNPRGNLDSMEADEKIVENEIIDELPPFVASSTNLGIRENPSVVDCEDNWEPQFIDNSAVDRTTETDILLQKVSDTLSNSLPIPPKPLIPSEKLENSKDQSDGTVNSSKISPKIQEIKVAPNFEGKNRDSLGPAASNIISADATLQSQQDTSDYVSATGDDLSITDWEYQLPAPPSAFRDNVSTDFDGYDTITLGSVEAFKETIVQSPESDKKAISDDLSIEKSPISESREIADSKKAQKPKIQQESSIQSSESKKCDFSSEKTSRGPEKFAKPKSNIAQTFANDEKSEKPKSNNSQTLISNKRSEIPKMSSQLSSDSDAELKKDVISELANKIETGLLVNGKIGEIESRKAVENLAPKIAPVDNTLANFTITTYSRQKSLNIFDEETSEEKREKRGPSKFQNFEKKAQTLGTSFRTSGGNYFTGRENIPNGTEKNPNEMEKNAITRAQSVEHIAPEVELIKKPHYSVQINSLLRHPSFQNGQEKSTSVHRSKSYITLGNNSKYREDGSGDESKNDEKISTGSNSIVKSTSVTNLNQEAPRNNEKFSQWRENILKRQEEPSKEKQLQSLQVLKNILPQLKTAQQTEENVLDSPTNEDNSKHRSKASSEVDQVESKSESNEPRKIAEESATRRYKYTGPPAINVGSWSERPRVSVQVKSDKDYKLGSKNNVSGAKTLVNLNGPSSNERNHETTDGRSTNSKISKPELKRNSSLNAEKPIITSVALKKTFNEKSDSQTPENQRKEAEDDVKIDTKSVNFKDLARAFGQEVCLRSKPRRGVENRHSDFYGTSKFDNFASNSAKIRDFENKNTTRDSDVSKASAPQKRYTSVVGIQPQNNNFSNNNVNVNNNNCSIENGDSRKNGETMKNQSLKFNCAIKPVVKGFRIHTMCQEKSDEKPENGQIFKNSLVMNSLSKTPNSKAVTAAPPPPPSPPTMPIITGVTLKNSTARPKSAPISNSDPRDDLLESIRSFGGRNRLKNVNTLY